MRKEDEELLERLAKETEREGLEFHQEHEPEKFHKVVKRLIETPPAPKQQRGKKRGITKSRGRKR